MMSRSNGTFPRYIKLDVDPDQWPTNYFSSCQYCEVCEMRWPASHLFSICPRCAEKTEVDTHNAPDIRWPDAIRELLTARFEDFYEQYNEGLTDEQLAWDEVKQTAPYDFDALEAEVEDLRSKAA